MKDDKLKILVLDHETGFIGPSCFRGFQTLGHTVSLRILEADKKTLVLNPIDLPELLKDVISFGPDLIFDINGKGCDGDGIALNAYRILGIPVFIWFLDNPLIALDYGRYRYSHLFTKLVFDRFLKKEMEGLGLTDLHHLPLGADTEYFRPFSPGPDGIKDYACNISFIGNLFADKCRALRLLLKERWPDMPEVMNSVIDSSVERLLSSERNMVTSRVIRESLRRFEFEPVYPSEDIEWLINIIIEHESARDLRAELISPLLVYNIRIYGDRSWSEILSCYDICPPVPYFEGLPGIYNSTAINLNISRTQLRTAVNQRVFDVPACRSFLLTDYKEELEEYFVIGREVACYKDRADLCRSVAYYLDNPGAREKIALAGYERVMKEHTYVERMKSVIDIYRDIGSDNFNEVNDRDDSWGIANLHIGEAYIKLGKQDKARYYFQKSLNPKAGNYVQCLNAIGVTWLRKGEYGECLNIFREAAARDPEEPSFFSNLGLAYCGLGRYDKAESAYKRALEIEPGYEVALNNLNNLYKKYTPLRPDLIEVEASPRCIEKPGGGQPENKGAGEPRMSLCMIVRDEEDNLPRCLNSLKGLIYELIIVDTGSGDRTVEIARGYNARIIHHKWRGDFSEARNVSIEAATGNWILVLDADEVMAEGDIEALKNLCGSKECDAYSFITRNYTDESSGAIWVPNDGAYAEGRNFAGWFPSRKIRLFRNDKRIRFTGVVHELVDPVIKKSRLRIREAGIPVHHYGATKSGPAAEKKIIRYLDYGKNKIEADPENPKGFYEYGIQCSEAGLHEDAVRAFRRVLDMEPDFPYVEGLLGASLIVLGHYDDAISYLQNGISREPENPGLYNNLASAYFEKKEFARAIDLYKKAVYLHPEYASAYKNMGLAYLQTGEADEAAESFRKAATLNPAMSFIK